MLSGISTPAVANSLTSDIIDDIMIFVLTLCALFGNFLMIYIMFIYDERGDGTIYYQYPPIALSVMVFLCSLDMGFVYVIWNYYKNRNNN